MHIHITNRNSNWQNLVVPCLLCLVSPNNGKYFLIEKPHACDGGAGFLDGYHELYRSNEYDVDKHSNKKYWWVREYNCEVVEDFYTTNASAKSLLTQE